MPVLQRMLLLVFVSMLRPMIVRIQMSIWLLRLLRLLLPMRRPVRVLMLVLVLVLMNRMDNRERLWGGIVGRDSGER